MNLSGIVVDISEPKLTNRNGNLDNNNNEFLLMIINTEWMRYIHIVEPRSFNDDNLGSSRGFKVNCFTRRYKEWLPHPNLGEPIILRDVKVMLNGFWRHLSDVVPL